jgi:hypothetical protein
MTRGTAQQCIRVMTVHGGGAGEVATGPYRRGRAIRGRLRISEGTIHQ